jgi:hypothetical protein
VKVALTTNATAKIQDKPSAVRQLKFGWDFFCCRDLGEKCGAAVRCSRPQETEVKFQGFSTIRVAPGN